MPRDDEDFYGEGYGGEIEYRSELVHDLPEPDTDAPTGDGGNDDDGGGDDTGGGGGGDSDQ